MNVGAASRVAMLGYRIVGALVMWGRRSGRVIEAAAIHRPWAATSALMAAPTGPLLLAVTVNGQAQAQDQAEGAEDHGEPGEGPWQYRGPQQDQAEGQE